ncbi:hypothetical protein [Dehalobacter sp. TBBPA1]|uniref:hypothetical protein n=1 Tax=Dehalobacter sp. TBBPA1 TaxID=3235037 RepID=UPI0034A21F07
MEFMFNPKDFINSPYGDCPFCKDKNSFGVLMIHTNSYTRRCKTCMKSQSYRLPNIRKTIIYLDQFVISNMMKVINPKWKDKGIVTQSFWREMFEKLDILSKYQLIICPDSITHFDESVVSSNYKQLKRMYELLSYGITFEEFSTLERFITCEYARKWVRNEVIENDSLLDLKSVIRGDFNKWQDRFIISVDLGNNDLIIDEIETHNERCRDDITNLFEAWRSSDNFNFNEHYLYELDQSGKMIVKIYMEYLQQCDRIFKGDTSVNPEILMGNNISILVHSVKSSLVSEGIQSENSLEKTFEFFLSDHYKKLPPLRISSLMWTALARRAAVVKQKRIPKGSIFNDIKTISNIFSYCDAIFIDKECASLLEEVKSEIGYNDTRIFSMNTLDEFFLYLDNIKENMSKEHENQVYEVYGKDRIKPYTEMYL